MKLNPIKSSSKTIMVHFGLLDIRNGRIFEAPNTDLTERRKTKTRSPTVKRIISLHLSTKEFS